MVSRRSVLLGLAGVSVVAIGGGTTFAFTRTPHAALAPWADPGAAADPRVAALEWAVLAPNPHNRQPWLVELVGEGEAILTCDLDRRLPMTDPFDRQITIGLGCFLEMFELAARANGYAVTTRLFPEGAPSSEGRLDARPVAHLALVPSEPSRDPLFDAAPHRRTTKEPFTDRAVSAETLARITAAARATRTAGTLDPAAVEALADLCLSAWMVEAHTERTHGESVDLMRIGRAEIEANPDGIDLGGPFLEGLSLAGLLTRETLATPGTMAFQTGIDMYTEMIGTARGFVWSITDTNAREAQIAAGGDWLRLNLAATAAGVAIQPLSQPLQEYEEMAELFAKVHAALGVAPPARVQMLARIGYAPPVPPSPRWPARSRLV